MENLQVTVGPFFTKSYALYDLKLVINGQDQKIIRVSQTEEKVLKKHVIRVECIEDFVARIQKAEAHLPLAVRKAHAVAQDLGIGEAFTLISF